MKKLTYVFLFTYILCGVTGYFNDYVALYLGFGVITLIIGWSYKFIKYSRNKISKLIN